MSTVLLLKRETSSSLKLPAPPASGFVGYLLKISVDVAHGIDSNIFVMRRDVNSSYSDGVNDVFYSVSSVGELEWIPPMAPDPNGPNFFRVSSLELMFETPQDLEAAWIKISTLVLQLAEANDLSIDATPDMVAMYPSDAFPRYYGNTVASPTVDQVMALPADTVYSASLSTSELSDGTNYFSFAYPAGIGTGALSVDGTLTTTNFSTITVVNKYGASLVYNLYTTAAALSSASHVVTFVKS